MVHNRSMYKIAQANAAEGTENLTDKKTDLKRIEKIMTTWKAAKEEKIFVDKHLQSGAYFNF